MRLLLLFLTLLPLTTYADWVVDDSSVERPFGCADAEAGEVSIGFWNIAFGSVQGAALQENLRLLARSSCAPDFLAFAEYQEDALSPETNQALNERYPYRRFLQYSQRVTWRGFLILSKTSFNQVAHLRELDWVPPHLRGAERAAYLRWADEYYTREESQYYARRLNHFVVPTRNGPLTLYPTHLAQPMAIVSERYGLYGSVEAGIDLLFDTNNPLGHQTRSLLRATQGAQNALIFGDLNFSPAVNYHGLGRRTPYYEMFLSEGWSDAFRGDGPPTFPALSSPKADEFPYTHHPFQFDHVFRTDQVLVRGLRSPRLRGSDHYPLFFIARVRGR